jgi:hypothetical protein
MADQSIRSAQQALLTAILAREPLGDTERALKLPDLDYVLRRPTILLADSNLAPEFRSGELPRPTEVLSEEEIAELAASEGEIAYIKFQPAEIEGDIVRLTLELRIVAPGRQPLGLGGARVALRRENTTWHLAEQPALFGA